MIVSKWVSPAGRVFGDDDPERLQHTHGLDRVWRERRRESRKKEKSVEGRKENVEGKRESSGEGTESAERKKKRM